MNTPLKKQGRLPLIALIVGVIGEISGCGSPRASKPQCVFDGDCGDGVCMMSTCLPRGTARTVAIEILPRTDSTSARTGIPDVALGPAEIALGADDRVTVDGTVTNAPDAHVVLSTLGPIPGQGDLQFETELASSKFELGLGQSFLSKMATIWLLPSAKNQDQPPVPFATTVAATLNLTFPLSAEMTMVRAVLHDSLDAALTGYVARAYVGTKVASNAVSTDDTGLFQLLIAPGTVPPEAGGMVTVEFTPVDPTNGGLRFVTKAFSATSAATNAKPRTFRMPAFATAAPLRFTVLKGATIAVVDAGINMPIADVTVRFRAEIPATQDGVVIGTAIYEREEHTTPLGEVEVSLIPGTATDPLKYQITILPPPDSPYAGRCVPEHPVTMVGNGQYSTTFSLDPKVTLKGTVISADGSPAAGASVTATFIPGNPLCTNPASTSPVSNTTDRDGTYKMVIDPGTYRLDIDPAAGAPLPRLTEDGDQSLSLSVGTDTTHDVRLPAGEAVDGVVTDADGLPVTSAGIKIFQVLCDPSGATCQGPSRIAPSLRSQTRTDMNGRFRAVLPSP